MTIERGYHMPSPCDEDYDAMRDEGGARRKCEACSTTVHDLMAMPEAEAGALLATARDRRLCVRAPTNASGKILLRLALAPLAFAACTPVYAMGIVEDHGPPNMTSSSSTSAGAERREWNIERGPMRMHIIDEPGYLIDSNAPPPPPGQPIAPHPFLSGSCGLDAVGCSEAGNILRESMSTDDYIERLTKAGFTVKPIIQ